MCIGHSGNVRIQNYNECIARDKLAIECRWFYTFPVF
jgi:hypothetical protein